MSYIHDEGGNHGTLFPAVLDDFVPTEHMSRVIDAFVERLVMSELGFERAQAADMGRPGYDPRDLLKLYLYGYLNQIRSSRRLRSPVRVNAMRTQKAGEAGKASGCFFWSWCSLKNPRAKSEASHVWEASSC
jgi:hypothetical protein